MDIDLNKFGPGMKHADVRPCHVCKRGVMHDRQLACTRVRVTRMFPNLRAIQRQHGLELMIGNAAIANVMGENSDLLVPIHAEETLLVCDDCAIKTGIHRLWERDEQETEPTTEPPSPAPALGERDQGSAGGM